jgi:aerotolerance regulator-like protein
MSAVSQFIVSNPLASIGFISLLIPILIHLFNPNRGKTILIGNLQLIKKAINKTVTEVRIRQWLLLATRLAFLSILTLIIIELIFPKTSSKEQNQAVFVTPAWLQQASEKEKKNLLSRHLEQAIYLMTPGFKPITQLSKQKDFPLDNYSLDSLLSEASAKHLLAAKNTIYFNQRSDFLALNRHSLFTINPQITSIEWVQLEENSANKNRAIPISVFYSADRAADYELLKLAFDTLLTTKPQLSIRYLPLPESSGNQLFKQLDNKGPEDTTSEVFFWLSSDPVPAALQQKVGKGSFLFNDSNLVALNNKQTHVSVQGLDFNVYHQMPKSNNKNFIPIWSSQDNSIVSFQPLGKGRLYQLHSRFNPDWNNLKQGAVLLELLEKLLALTYTNNNVAVSDAELLVNWNDKLIDDKDLSSSFATHRNLFVLLLMIVWLLERVLSESRVYNHD